MSQLTKPTKDTSPDPAALSSLVSECLELADRAGADGCEAAASHDLGLSVTVRLGEVETVEYQNDRSIGVTVYFGNRKGTATTADFSRRALHETVEAACRIARFTGEDQYSGLPDAAALASELPELDLDHPWPLSPEQAIAIACETEDAARDADPRIANSEGATVNSQRGSRCVGNSHGFVGTTTGTHHSVSCVVIAADGDGMQRDWWYTTARDRDDLDDVREVGRTAAGRALRRLGARKIGTRHAPVLFAPEVSRGLFAQLLSAISGSAQYRKASFLLGALGEQVFPSWLSVFEDPWIPRGPASAAFDAEGVATRPSALVDAGVLRSYLLDTYAARRLGMSSTGHAGGWTNVTVTGDATSGELLERMGSGLLVTELMGQGVNAVTGDYSRGATGFWVENGRIAYPVHEVTIAGNLKAMFRDLQGVGDDYDPRLSLRVGSVLVPTMAIAGE